MSVLIKDMDLPEDCYSCPLKEEGYCNITYSYATCINRRNSDCPLTQIVHCKECANYYNNHLCLHWSKHGTIETKPDDYCSYGERL